MNEYDILKSVPLFKGMNEEEINEALEVADARKKYYHADDIISNEGDPVVYAGIVLQGCIQVIRDDYNGNRDIIGQMPAPGLFGEALCFCGIKEMPVSIIAKEDSCVLQIRLKDKILPEKMQANLLSEISVKVLNLTNKIRIVQQKTTAEKLMCYFRLESKRNRSNEFSIRFSRQELADYLGVDRSAMIVELRKLKENGLIDVNGKNIRLIKKSQ